jgi:hypothetical protein
VTGKDWAFFLVAVAGVVFGIVQWLRPRAPKALRPEPPVPPNLRVDQVGSLGSTKGSPTEDVKATLELVNEGPGPARNWQVSIGPGAGHSVRAQLGRLPNRGPATYREVVRWEQDASVGEVPPHQRRELPDWLLVKAPPDALEVYFPVTVKADSMPDRTGTVVVTFPSGIGGPAVRFDL